MCCRIFYRGCPISFANWVQQRDALGTPINPACKVMPARRNHACRPMAVYCETRHRRTPRHDVHLGSVGSGERLARSRTVRRAHALCNTRALRGWTVALPMRIACDCLRIHVLTDDHHTIVIQQRSPQGISPCAHCECPVRHHPAPALGEIDFSSSTSCSSAKWIATHRCGCCAKG